MTTAPADDDFPDVIEPCENGALPSYSSTDGSDWVEHCDGMSAGFGLPGWFVLFFVLAILATIATTVWRVSTARRMARASGMNVADATAMTLLEEDGLSATYLASNLRGPAAQATPQTPTPAPAPPAGSTAQRLRELADLRDQGLITRDEYDERRARILDGV